MICISWRIPNYIRLPALMRHLPNSTSTPRVVEVSSRNNAWRTESVLYIFLDTWLRYNFDETLDPPSLEFVRMVRALVKQLHMFGNAAEYDNTSMAELRKLAQPMLSVHMFTFLKGIISRWPLDGSFQAVLELWLSYIQVCVASMPMVVQCMQCDYFFAALAIYLWQELWVRTSFVKGLFVLIVWLRFVCF